jgi:hypothetical protein
MYDWTISLIVECSLIFYIKMTNVRNIQKHLIQSSPEITKQVVPKLATLFETKYVKTDFACKHHVKTGILVPDNLFWSRKKLYSYLWNIYKKVWNGKQMTI